jgi:hypothetical protein
MSAAPPYPRRMSTNDALRRRFLLVRQDRSFEVSMGYILDELPGIN